MCACEWNFTCARHRAPEARYMLALDPCYQDWREQEQEQREQLLSQHDFESPFRDAL